MITVTNKYHYPTSREDVKTTVVYCGRGSSLGNPFKMMNQQDRDRVCNNFEAYLPAKLQEDSRESALMHRQLNEIAKLAKIGDVQLQCFCAPKRCHCETIKSYVEDILL